MGLNRHVQPRAAFCMRIAGRGTPAQRMRPDSTRCLARLLRQRTAPPLMARTLTPDARPAPQHASSCFRFIAQRSLPCPPRGNDACATCVRQLQVGPRRPVHGFSSLSRSRTSGIAGLVSARARACGARQRQRRAATPFRPARACVARALHGACALSTSNLKRRTTMTGRAAARARQ